MSIFNRYYTRVLVRHADCCEGDEDGYEYVPQFCNVSMFKPFTFNWLNIRGLAPGVRGHIRHAENAAGKDAAERSGAYLGVHDSTKRQPLNPLQKLLKKIRDFFTGPMGQQGIPGAPGCQGPMGMRGPAYDDLECPHCGVHRSRTGVYLLMEAEVGGVFSYTCADKKCKQKSLWKPINGVWVWQGHPPKVEA